MAKGIKGRPVARVKKASEQFVKRPELLQLHPYALNLVERMNEKGITVAITGQPQELAEALLKVLPFHMSIGTEFEVKNGHYTGKVKRNMALSKGKFLRELRKHTQYWRGISYGFADRVTDKELLESTRKPIALNPDKRMKRMAKRKGWKIANGKKVLHIIRRRKNNARRAL